MLQSIKHFSDFKIDAMDGKIGKVDTFLFDNISWIIRYLVVDTGSWIPGRKVLISPISTEPPNSGLKVIPVELTREQVKNSPDVDMDKPVSRQCEIELHKYYQWTPYWGGGVFATPVAPPTQKDKEKAAQEAKQKVNSTLRSTDEIIDYRLHASDGDIGHIDDFIMEDKDWTIRYIVVNTRNWLPGQSVLISPEWIQKISWAESKVWVDLSKETIKGSPKYDPSAPVNREYEAQLYDYYGRPKYWA